MSIFRYPHRRTDVGLPDEGGEDHGGEEVEEVGHVPLEAHHPVDDDGEERLKRLLHYMYVGWSLVVVVVFCVCVCVCVFCVWV